MSSYAERLRAVVDRHLTGEQPLEAAASEFISVWWEWMRARGTNRPTTLEQLLVDRPDPDLLSSGSAFGVNLSSEESRQLEAFLRLVNRKLLDGDTGAV